MRYHLRIGVVGFLTHSPHITKLPSPRSLVQKLLVLINKPLKFGSINWLTYNKIRHLGDQSHPIQNKWLVATPKIKIRKMDSHTHTHTPL